MIKGENSVYPIRKSSGGWHWQKVLSELVALFEAYAN